MQLLKKLMLVVCVAGVAFAQNTASTKYALDKKLIEYGWDVKNSEYVAKNIRQMEKRPFDGIIFRLCAGGRVFNFTKPDLASFDKDFKACSEIKWDKFTDNFIILFAASKQDWFNDEHWANITENARLMTRAAKMAKCVGICFDHEPYGFNPWSYKTAEHSKEKSFAEYEAIARKRGAQFMKAVESEMPGLTILTFFQLSYFGNISKPMDPQERAKTLSGLYYALLPAFLNGMLDVATPQAQIVDGNESAYYYTKSDSYFTEYFQVRQSAKLLVAEENQFKYHNQMQVGQSLYIDQYFDKRAQKLLSHYMTPEEQQKWFEHNIFWALYTTDRYVWCYSEKMDWWLNKSIPQGAEQAIIDAKAKLAKGDKLGFTMTEIVDRAQKRQEEEINKKLLIQKADIKKLPAGTAAPVIDGKIDDAAWAAATKLIELKCLAGRKETTPKGRTYVSMTYDAENLYISAKCMEPNMKDLHATAQSHDSDAIWLGDDLELFFATQPGKTVPFSHFIIDPNAVTWDAMHTPDTDTGFNPVWKCASTKEKDAWIVEIAIPWSSIGMKAPAKGTEIRGNICRQNSTQHELSAWSAQVGGFLEHNLFGTFKFVE